MTEQISSHQDLLRFFQRVLIVQDEDEEEDDDDQIHPQIYVIIAARETGVALALRSYYARLRIAAHLHTVLFYEFDDPHHELLVDDTSGETAITIYLQVGEDEYTEALRWRFGDLCRFVQVTGPLSQSPDQLPVTVPQLHGNGDESHDSTDTTRNEDTVLELGVPYTASG